ncbi:MAG: hypothetical protein IJX91_03145 [Clostridia bacterium]|nr:hypothetical protein [Clostridia bacterium]
MEERIIDDEYGRGIRLKKTKDGYVDVTDELAENGEAEVYEEDAQDEIAFEFPMSDADEDDEDLVGLSPEEAARVRREKEEAAAKRKADYEQACKEGEQLLASGSFKAAELKYEKALQLDDEATDASVGYWRAKTADFTEPDALIGEYADAGIESLEYDLGADAVDKLRVRYAEVFRRRVRELETEEAPLAEALEGKRQKRRGILSERLKKAAIGFGVLAVPTIVLLVLTIVLGMKNFTTSKNTYIVPTVICGVAFFACFIVFVLASNRLINVLRLRSSNERTESTEEGARLVKIRDYKELYECLLLPTEESVGAGE